MKDLAVETLRGRGDEVEVTDLYAMRFNAVVAVTTFTASGPTRNS
jgi:putative NADPH-quinone reductase